MNSEGLSDKGPTDLRKHFLLDRAVTCLNHGMVGACPVPVLERQSELRTRIEQQPAAFFFRDFPTLLDNARQALATLISVDPADLVFVPNVTTALSSVLRSRAFVPGDEILTTDHAYLACANLLDFVARERGVRVVTAAIAVPLAGPDEVIEAVLAHATPRTRLAVLDHVTSPTGIVFPIATLVERLAARGVDTLVDGAHAPGMLQLDVEAIGAAYYAGDCHKWLCSPRGAGFLHVRRDRQDRLHPAVIGRCYGEGKGDQPRLHREFDWVGTADPTPLLCVPDAIRFLSGLLPGGLPELLAHNHALAVKGARRLVEHASLTRVAPDSMVGSMVAFQLSCQDEAAVPMTAGSFQRWLYEEHCIDVAVTSELAAPGQILRVSAQCYNSLQDFDQLATALRQQIELETWSNITGVPR